MEKQNKFQSIQVIRGFACILVILCHTYFTNFGVVAVDFFFVISGFVIMYSTEKGGKEFWKKRLFRILPLYWFMTLMTAFFVAVLPDLFNSYEVTPSYLIKSLLFIPYYHNQIKGPLLGLGWTLMHEMFFYVLFFIAMKLNHKARGSITIFFTAVVVCLGKYIHSSVCLNYWSDNITWEFCWGILLYDIYKNRINESVPHEISQKKKVIITVLLLVLLGTVYYWMDTLSARGVSRPWGAGLFAAGILFLFLCCENYLCAPHWLIYIGNISYSIYLIHIYPVRLVETICARFTEPSLFTAVLQIFVAILFCVLWYELIEKRVMAFCKKKLFSNR